MCSAFVVQARQEIICWYGQVRDKHQKEGAKALRGPVDVLPRAIEVKTWEAYGYMTFYI
jgi:hypothetical protein